MNIKQLSLTSIRFKLIDFTFHVSFSADDVMFSSFIFNVILVGRRASSLSDSGGSYSNRRPNETKLAWIKCDFTFWHFNEEILKFLSLIGKTGKYED